MKKRNIHTRVKNVIKTLAIFVFVYGTILLILPGVPNKSLYICGILWALIVFAHVITREKPKRKTVEQKSHKEGNDI